MKDIDELGRKVGSENLLAVIKAATKPFEKCEDAGQPESDNHPRAEMDAALKTSIRPCTMLAELAIAPRERVLGDWFKEADLGFIFAPRGLGKTWLSLAMATAIADGRECGPWRAAVARRVLYVDGEMPCESLGERIAGMGGVENLAVLNHEALFHLSGKVLNLV